MISATVTTSPTSTSLTHYPEGSFRELMTLLFPLVLSLLSGSLMGFCDRLFLSHYSLDALKAVSSANYLCIFFQLTCMRVATMNQVYVSKHIGSHQKGLTGAYTWQMIWFALFSMLFTLPLSQLVAPLFFNHSEIAHLGKLYFFPLMYINFLFPLGSALAAFYIGKGKSLIVAAVTLMANLFNILLNYWLIFGIKGWIPSLGISGAAIATALSQTVYCAILFCLFLKEDKEYQTRDFSFKRKLFWNCIQTGVPRALGKMSTLIAWASGVALVNRLGGDYLLVLSMGSTLCLILSPFSEGIGLALTTLVAYFRGAKKWSYIWLSLRASSFALLLELLLLSLPFYFFREKMLDLFFKENLSAESLSTLRLSCYWLWLFFFLEGWSCIGICLLTGLEETFYLLKMYVAISWPTIFFPIYFGFYFWGFSPDKLWMLSCISCLVGSTFCFYKGHSIIKRLQLSTALTI